MNPSLDAECEGADFVLLGSLPALDYMSFQAGDDPQHSDGFVSGRGLLLAVVLLLLLGGWPAGGLCGEACMARRAGR